MYSIGLVNLLLIILLFEESICFSKLPSYIVPCKRSDPSFNVCALKHGQDALKDIIKGDSTYHIPSFNPLHLTNLSFNENPNIKLHSNNTYLGDFTTAEFKDINWDFDKKQITIKLYMPEINAYGFYIMHGKMLIMQLDGSGAYNCSQYSNDVVISVRYSLNTHNDKEYMHLEKVVFNIETKSVRLHFDNLLNNPELSGQLNAFINENWRVFYKEIFPSFYNLLTSIAMSIVSPIVAKVPYNDIVLP